MNNTAEKTDTPAEGSSSCPLKERILLAAIQEFGRRGYDAASTNAVVSSAGVSKGLLFHYYGSKEKLFLESSDYVIGQMAEYMIGRLDLSSNDIFDRLRHSLQVKMQFFNEHPVFIGIINLWFSEDRPLIEPLMEKHICKHQDANNNPDYILSLLLQDAELSKINDGIDLGKAIGYISMLLDACWNRFAAKYDNDPHIVGANTDEYLAEAEVVLDIMKRGIYRA